LPSPGYHAARFLIPDNVLRIANPYTRCGRIAALRLPFGLPFGREHFVVANPAEREGSCSGYVNHLVRVEDVDRLAVQLSWWSVPPQAPSSLGLHRRATAWGMKKSRGPTLGPGLTVSLCRAHESVVCAYWISMTFDSFFISCGANFGRTTRSTPCSQVALIFSRSTSSGSSSVWWNFV